MMMARSRRDHDPEERLLASWERRVQRVSLRTKIVVPVVVLAVAPALVIAIDQVGQYICLNAPAFDYESRPAEFNYRTLLVYAAHTYFAWVRPRNQGSFREPCFASTDTLMAVARLSDRRAFRGHRRTLHTNRKTLYQQRRAEWIGSR